MEVTGLRRPLIVHSWDSQDSGSQVNRTSSRAWQKLRGGGVRVGSFGQDTPVLKFRLPGNPAVPAHWTGSPREGRSAHVLLE